MSKVEFELVSEGIVELLKSPEILSVCEEYANNALQKLGAGYVSDSYARGKSRVNVSVRAESRKAIAENSEHNTILKAVTGG